MYAGSRGDPSGIVTSYSNTVGQLATVSVSEILLSSSVLVAAVYSRM